MSVILDALALVKVLIFTIIICFCFIYCLPILLIPRFHCRSNILTVNLSIAFMCCCIYWLIYCISYDYFNQLLTYEKSYAFQIYAQIMCTCQLVFAFIAIPINQLLPIIYHTKLFFKTKKCLTLCILAQWIAGFIVPVPLIFQQQNQVGYKLNNADFRNILRVYL